MTVRWRQARLKLTSTLVSRRWTWVCRYRSPFNCLIYYLDARRMSKTHNSACLLLSYSDTDKKEVMALKWGNTTQEVNGHDYISTRFAGSIIDVPSYRIKEIFRVGEKFVSVGIRSYMEGTALSKCYRQLTRDQINALTIETQVIVWGFSNFTSQHFSYICDGALRTETPAAPKVSDILPVAKYNGELNNPAFQEVGRNGYKSQAVLYYRGLTADHIIVKDGQLSEIIGWSKADFVSEIADRLQYYFKSVASYPYSWERSIANIALLSNTEKPSVEFVINSVEFEYNVTWNRAILNERKNINILYNSLKSQPYCAIIPVNCKRNGKRYNYTVKL